MRLDAIRSPVSLSAWVIPLGAASRLEPGAVNLGFGEVSGEYSIRQQSKLVTVTLKAPRQTEALNGLLGSGRARLARVDQVSADGATALVTVHLFNGGVLEIGDVDVGIDDRAQSAARRLLLLKTPGIEALTDALADLCSIGVGPTNEDRFFLLAAGAAAARDFAGPDGAGRGEAEVPAPAVAPLDRAFCIHGDGIRIAVARRRVTQDEEKYLATRLTSSLGADPDGSLRLARGRLTFSDFTRTGRIRALAAGTMAKLMEASGGYLRKWDEYGALEGQMLLDRARRVGMLRWTAVEQVTRGGSGVRFFFGDPLPSGIDVDDELEICEEVPDYLEQPGMTWAEYSARLEGRTPDENEDSGGKGRTDGDTDESAGAGAVAKVLDVDDRSLVLDFQMPPEKPGLFLLLSLGGDRAQIERRMEARRLILEGRSANPMLGVLIEENGEPPEPSRRSTTPPLTAFVRRKVFSHPPTPKQIEAIDIALNTPDIALIQGPPGTGKTTVIAAIVERLNELADKGRSIQGEVLISAYQHDAIENMMARLTVNSLPVPKFGRRSGKIEIGDRNAENLQRWCDGIAARLREKNPGLGVAAQLREAQIRCHEYVLAPSLNNALGTIDAFLNLPGGRLPERLAARARALRERLEHERSGRAFEPDNEILRGVWSIRTTAEGFLDDGPAMAQALLGRIGADLPPDSREILARASAWTAAEPPPFLADLRRLKSELVEWYRPQAAFRIDKPRRDVLEIVREAEQEILHGTTTGESRTNWILAEFLHELESNPAAAQRVVEDYGFAFAATCQASRGKAITRRKNKAVWGENGARDYDTVVVDEAARTSPRDLLIPMSQARRRIILVGDHRQLPHMINEEIARTLEGEGDPQGRPAAAREADFVRHSMFQYLLLRLKQLKKRDHVKRWVALDQQFRMHPLLGDFVSDHFYRVHDEAEAFRSPLPARHFVHDLSDVPEVPAVWLDLPATVGEEDRIGTSHRRVAEARLIASWIKRWIDTPAGRKLTFGVIAFYSAQVNEVFASLSAYGLATREADGWRIDEQYRLRPAEEGLPKEERLRIGTVDSFQGMEFDVVFLSMVRSRRRLAPRPAAHAGRAKWEQQVYGHLTSPNRLCVSMSRQKRLLVVVGDKAMVEREEAESAIPCLAAFLALCRKHGQVREWEASGA